MVSLNLAKLPKLFLGFMSSKYLCVFSNDFAVLYCFFRQRSSIKSYSFLCKARSAWNGAGSAPIGIPVLFEYYFTTSKV